jgi:hypothetical protein
MFILYIREHGCRLYTEILKGRKKIGRSRRTSHNVRSEVFTAVAMKTVVFWDIKTRLYLTGDKLHLYRAQPVNAM